MENILLNMRYLFVLLGGLIAAIAQEPPYDRAPNVREPYFRVRYEASSREDRLRFPVQYTLWIPEDVSRLRGLVVHQHGCGEGSCLSGQTGAFDLHWQALARKHQCALLSPSYEQPNGEDCQMWCDPRNGSDLAFQRALKELGAASGHHELSRVPWALWGHSGGGHWAGGMVMLHPERVAAAWLRSGVPYLAANPKRPDIRPHELSKAALGVPMMCNLGTKEGVTVTDGRFAGVWPANQLFFETVRHQGGLVGIAVDPFSSHDCGNQRYLAIPWLDACLASRLPEEIGEALHPMPRANAQFALPLGKRAVSARDFRGNPDHAVWLPNEGVARMWEHYVRDTRVPDPTPPPSPVAIRLEGNTLTWNTEADVESGLAAFEIRLKDQGLIRLPAEGKNRFGRPLFQGLQYSDTPVTPLVEMKWVDERLLNLSLSDVEVRAVNTVGLVSQ